MKSRHYRQRRFYGPLWDFKLWIFFLKKDENIQNNKCTCFFYFYHWSFFLGHLRIVVLQNVHSSGTYPNISNFNWFIQHFIKYLYLFILSDKKICKIPFIKIFICQLNLYVVNLSLSNVQPSVLQMHANYCTFRSINNVSESL